jgi:hypothetical protein
MANDPAFEIVCNEPQFMCPSGIVCKNGHGGAESVEDPDKELANDPAYETVCNERNDAAIQRMEQDAEAEALIRSRVVSSIVLRGDLSALTEEQLTRYYASLCESLSLDVRFKPFDVLILNGRKVLYANRACTDMLAKLHGITREIIDGPRFVELDKTKAIICIARATSPSGRQETATAVVPANDPINGIMKCETKAKRRATLAILGLGLLDHTELDTIPGIKLPQDAPQSNGEAPTIVRDPLDVAEDMARAIRDDSTLSRGEKMNRWSSLITSTSIATRLTSKMSPEAVAKELTRRLK